MTSSKYNVDEFIAAIQRDWSEASDAVRNAVLSSSDWFKVLAIDDEFAHSVVLNKQLPDDVLLHLAKNSDPKVRSMVAGKNKLPLSALEIFCKDSDFLIRRSVVGRFDTPKRILCALLSDPEEEIRDTAELLLELHSIAEKYNISLPANSSFSKETLEIVLQNAGPLVRAYIVSRPKKIPVDLLLKLACDPSPYVRSEVVFRGELPFTVLTRLSMDIDDVVAKRAKDRIRMFTE